MKKVMNIFLGLVATISFLPSMAMEKEQPLTDADKAFLKAADQNNCPDIIAALKNGANVNVQDEYRNTALHKAIQHGNYELFEALCNGKLNPCVRNKYDLYPIFYIDEKLDFLQQYNLVALTISKAILRQIRYELRNNKKIKQIDSDTIEGDNKCIELFNKTIGKKQKNFYCYLYDDFFYATCSYLPLALEDYSDKMIPTKDVDPLLPFFDLLLAQKKISHLLQVLKIINTVAYAILHKPLTTVEKGKSIEEDKDAQATFGSFHDFKRFPETGLIGLYGLQLKNIVDNPTKYIREIKQKLTIALKADKLKQLSLKFVPVVTLLQKGLHFLNTPNDQKIIDFIVINTSKSNINPEQFALAFTSFARLRESSLRETQK